MLHTAQLLNIAPSEFWAMTPAELAVRSQAPALVHGDGTSGSKRASDAEMDDTEWREYMRTFGEQQEAALAGA